jgi:transposase
VAQHQIAQQGVPGNDLPRQGASLYDLPSIDLRRESEPHLDCLISGRASRPRYCPVSAEMPIIALHTGCGATDCSCNPGDRSTSSPTVSRPTSVACRDDVLILLPMLAGMFRFDPALKVYLRWMDVRRSTLAALVEQALGLDVCAGPVRFQQPAARPDQDLAVAHGLLADDQATGGRPLHGQRMPKFSRSVSQLHWLLAGIDLAAMRHTEKKYLQAPVVMLLV